jgi:copper transporter 1
MSGKVQSSASKEDSTEASRDGPIPARRQHVPPFVPSHDIPRGVIQAMQSTFSYAFMLVVM